MFQERPETRFLESGCLSYSYRVPAEQRHRKNRHRRGFHYRDHLGFCKQFPGGSNNRPCQTEFIEKNTGFQTGLRTRCEQIIVLLFNSDRFSMISKRTLTSRSSVSQHSPRLPNRKYNHFHMEDNDIRCVRKFS